MAEVLTRRRDAGRVRKEALAKLSEAVAPGFVVHHGTARGGRKCTPEMVARSGLRLVVAGERLVRARQEPGGLVSILLGNLRDFAGRLYLSPF